jgi:hypothetical protein
MRWTKYLALAVLAASHAAAAAPTEADVADLRAIVARDASYSAEERAEAERLLDTLPALMKDEARFELQAARIIAIAGNGHTALFPAQWTNRYPRSPVRLGLFGDGLFVIAAPASQSHLVGSSVTAINGRPWRLVYDAFDSFQGGRQELRDQFVPYFMETPALLAAAGLGEDRNALRLTLEGSRKTHDVTVTPEMAPVQGEDEALLGTPLPRAARAALQGPAPLYLTKPDQYYVYERLPEQDAAYIRIDAIGGSGLEPFLTSTVDHLKTKPAANIILDLRFNMGGDLNRARAFAQALPALAADGKLYIITSGRSFSAAISTIGYARQAGPDKVVIVGEHAGDDLEFWAEGPRTVLPGLGATLLFATERHNYRTGCPEADCHGSIRDHPIRIQSIEPDIPAPLTFAAYRQGRDPAMEAIAADIRAGSSARR